MTISTTDAGTEILSIGGAITGRNIAQIQKTLDQYERSDCRRIQLDLSQVTFIDSTGAGLLVHSQRSFREHNKELVLSAPSESVMEILRLLGVDRLLRIVGQADPADSHTIA